MKAIRSKFVPTTWLILLAGVLVWTAQAAETNPYLSIPERNPFGLKDPPPPAPPPETAPPPAPPAATIKLTGITSIFSTHKALFEVTEPGAGAKPRKPILCEGERDGDLEVVSINVVKSEVTIRSAGVVTNITFAPLETAKTAPPAKAPAGRRAVPTRPGSRVRPTTAKAAANRGGPTIIGRGGAAQPGARSSVTVLGASASSSAAPTPRTGPTYNAAATAANRLRSIPTRTIRTDPRTTAPGAQPKSPGMTKEQLRYWIEANRMVNPQLPWPSTAPNPANAQ